MARFALRRYAFLSLLVAALFGSYAVHAEENENLRKELELINKDLASLDQTIEASDRLLAQNPWATTNCAWIVAGPGRFVALTSGRQWQLDDYIREVRASGRPAAVQEDLITRARGRVAEQTKVCNDPLVRNAAQFRADRTARLARKAEIEKRLAAPPPPPPGPATAWSGSWVTPIGSKFTIRIVGGKFICDGVTKSELDDQRIDQKDECDWENNAPVRCSYIQHQRTNDYFWKIEGESKFELKGNVIIRKTKASRSAFTFTDGSDEEEQTAVKEVITRGHRAEEFLLKRP